MALIVITIADSGNGDVEVGLLSEPAIPSDQNATLTPAQVVALDMVAASTREAPVKEDRGLIQLIN